MVSYRPAPGCRRADRLGGRVRVPVDRGRGVRSAVERSSATARRWAH